MEALPNINTYINQVRNNNIQTQNTVTNPIQQTTKTIDKKKLAVGVAAGIGITALVVGGLLYKHKVDSAKVKELAEHIDFKPAQTLDEAVKFGQEKLGIDKYKGFQEADLDVVNWVNEGLTNVSNKAKGKAIMPKTILFDNYGGDASADTLQNLHINKNEINKVKQSWLNMINNSKNLSSEQVAKLTDRTSMCKWACAKATKISLENNLKKDGRVLNSAFTTIYHEMGHLQHFNSLGFDTKKIASLDSDGQLPEKLSEGFKELRDLYKSKINLASNISGYAAKKPTEFVAEVYSCLCDGVKLPQETLDLYQKLGGVMI